jgi:hypothetical protein
VRGQHELRLRREGVGGLEIDWHATRGQVDQRRVGEAYVDSVSERGDGRIGALDQAVVADGLDLLQIVRVPAFFSPKLRPMERLGLGAIQVEGFD